MKATRQTHLKVNNSEIVEFTTEREIEIINDKIGFFKLHLDVTRIHKKAGPTD